MGLPTSGGFDGIVTIVDRFTKLTLLTPCTTDITAVATADIVFDNVIRCFGVPADIVSDRDPRFQSAFWKALMKKLGTHLQFSTAFHPETDGQTER